MPIIERQRPPGKHLNGPVPNRMNPGVAMGGAQSGLTGKPRRITPAGHAPKGYSACTKVLARFNIPPGQPCQPKPKALPAE